MVLTKAKNRWQVGELGIANPLRDGEAGNGYPSNEIGFEEVESVTGYPFEEWQEVLETKNESPGSWLVLELLQWVVREESLLERVLERFCKGLRRWNGHPVGRLGIPRRVYIVGVAHDLYTCMNVYKTTRL